MASQSDEVEMLLINNRQLERENRLLRVMLWDEFFKAALPVALKHGAVTGVDMAAEVADRALVVRNKRWGVE